MRMCKLPPPSDNMCPNPPAAAECKPRRRSNDDFLQRLARAERSEMPNWLLALVARGARSSKSPLATGRGDDGIETDRSSRTDRAGTMPRSQRSPGSLATEPSARRVPKLELTARGGRRKLELTLVDHPTRDGVVVSSLGASGACAKYGLHVGDHITRVDSLPATHHQHAVELADEAEGHVTFTLAERTAEVRLDRSSGQCGLTLVNNTLSGLGVVVAAVEPGLGAQQAGLRVGHVITAIDNAIASEHRGAIRTIDEARHVLSLVVCETVLTEESVLAQYVPTAPEREIEIRVSL